jgi:lambda repressor-like predicted transcriptional regulator
MSAGISACGRSRLDRPRRRDPLCVPTDVDPLEVLRDYLAGDPLRVVAGRYGRSMTWVRRLLDRYGVPRRPRGGVPEPVPVEWIVRLRDDACLSWAEIARITGLSDRTLQVRYAAAVPQGRRRRYNRLGADEDEEIWRRNDAINHRDDIVAAYRGGRLIADLAAEWGISQRTIGRWVAGSCAE